MNADSKASARAQPKAGENRLTSAEMARSWLLIIIIIALVYRILCFAINGSHPLYRYPIVDAKYHNDWAQRILAGDWFGHGPDDVFKPPLYPYFLAALYGIFGRHIWLVQSTQLFIGVLSCVLLAKLGARLLGWKIGFIAGLLSACYAPYVFFELQLLTPVLSLFLNLAALVLLMSPVNRPRFAVRLILAGLLLGLSLAVRPDAALSIFLIGLYLLFKIWNIPWSKRIVRASCVLASIVIVVLPITVRNYVLVQQVIPISSNAGINFYVGNSAGADGVSAVPVGLRWERLVCRVPQEVLDKPATAGRWWTRSAMREIRADLKGELVRLGRKAAAFWNRREFRNNICFHFMQQFCRPFRLSPCQLYLILPLGICGLVGLISSGQPALRRAGMLCLLWFVGYWLGGIVFFVTGRFRLPAIPLLMIPAAWTLTEITKVIRRRQWRRLVVFTTIISAVGIVCWPAWFGPYQSGWVRDNVNLCNSLSQAGNTNAALQACYMALEIAPQDPDANVQLGYMLLSHDTVSALKHFQIAEAQISDAPSLLLAMGQAYLQSDNQAQAQKLLQDLLNLDRVMNLRPKRDTWATAHILLAEIEPEHSSEHWEQAWSIDSRTTAEIAFTQSRELDRVLKTFQSEAAQKPWDWYSQANLGMILLKQERFLQAIQSLKRAGQLAPEKEGLSFQLAYALYHSGQTQQALQILDRLANELPAGGLLNQVNQLRYEIRAGK